MNLSELVFNPLLAIGLFGTLPGLIGLVVIGCVAWAERRRGFRGLGRMTWWETVLGGFLAGVVVWLAWLSWSVRPGTYVEWQVIACVTTVIVVAGVLAWFTRRPFSGPMLTCWAVTAGFSTAWVVPASQDETGLFGVGYLMLVVGGGALMLLLGVIIAFARYIVLHRDPRMPGVVGGTTARRV